MKNLKDVKSEQENSANNLSLSVGEKQLLSIARAMLRNANSRRIVVLDECSSSLDTKSDNEIQQVISREFSSSTTITIAHRFRTIITSDKILVMGKGEALEMDKPCNLLNDPNSNFSSMVNQLGETAANELRELANLKAK